MPKGFYPASEATAPGKLEGLNQDQLRQYYKYFAEAEEWLVDQRLVVLCRERMTQIEREIEMRRTESHADRHHREGIALGKETLDVGTKGLNWARVAGIAGIVAVLIAAASLIVQIYLAKTQPATPAAASPASSPQTTATMSALPESAATASSATPLPKTAAAEQTSTAPSPTASAASTPTTTPIKFPPPAP